MEWPSVAIASAAGGLGMLVSVCAEAQQRQPPAAEMYRQASTMAVSAEEAERALAPRSPRRDIAAGLAAIVVGGAVAAGGLPASPAAAVAPASMRAAPQR